MKIIRLCSILLITTATVNGQTIPGPNPGDTGSVVFTYRGSTVAYKTVRAADGNVWLQQNLGASKVADSMRDVNAYGDLFQWGRWDDGHQLRTSTVAQTSTLTANNPAGLGSGSINFYRSNPSPEWWSGGTPGTDTWREAPASATNGIDPCAAIGAGWHTPDSSDWGRLIRAENITNPATAFSSNLKLTLAGTRTTFGSMSNEGVAGAYHSRTLHGTSMSAQYLQIHANTNNINNTVAGPRSYGRTCRCIEGCFDPPALQAPEGTDTVCAGSTHTYTVPGMPPGIACAWYLPPGWTGTPSGGSITATAGFSGGLVQIGVAAINNCGDTGAISTIQVYVPPFHPVSIIVSGDTLATLGGGYVSWQWYRNGSLIPGATDSFYVVPQNDTFTVKVTDRYGCSDSSAIPYIVTNIGVANINAAQHVVRIYPNPAHSTLYIDAPAPVNIIITAPDGKTMLRQDAIRKVDISTLPAGIYIVRITDAAGNLSGMEKLIKITTGL